jgi:hypothetical protein
MNNPIPPAVLWSVCGLLADCRPVHRMPSLDSNHGGRLCLSSRLGLAVVAGLFIAEHDSPKVIGDPPLEAAHGFPGGLALGELRRK